MDGVEWIGVENFHYKFDRDTPPFASEEAACRFRSRMEVGFKNSLEVPKNRILGAF